MKSTRYFLKARWRDKWDEVSKEDYVTAERAASFYNTMGQPGEPATSSFSGEFGVIMGRTRFAHPNEKVEM